MLTPYKTDSCCGFILASLFAFCLVFCLLQPHYCQLPHEAQNFIMPVISCEFVQNYTGILVHFPQGKHCKNIHYEFCDKFSPKTILETSKVIKWVITSCNLIHHRHLIKTIKKWGETLCNLGGNQKFLLFLLFVFFL